MNIKEMLMRSICAISLATILTCCSSCNPAELEVAQDSQAEVRIPDTWETCDQKIGSHPCNFTFKDQNGDDWELYDHYGKVIVLDFSTMWCGYCQVAAGHAQEIQDKYESQGFVYVTILIEDFSGQDISQDEIDAWVDSFGVTTSPVLTADRGIIDQNAETGYPISAWPTFVVLNKDMIIENGMRGWSEEIIISLIEDALSSE